MKCEEIQGLLQEYVGRELDPERRWTVDGHLMECAVCQRELAIVSAVFSSLDHQAVLEPPPEFASRVIENLPRRNRLLVNPLWAFALVPVLAGLAWLIRGWVVRELTGPAATLQGVTESLRHVPTVGWAQAAIGLMVVVGLGLAVTVGGAVAAWQLLRD
jgi:hypothetical protein